MFLRTLHINVDTKKRAIPATIACFRPRFTNSPANTTPHKLDETADQKGISRIDAIIAPVQAPVPGNGTATKSISPNRWNSSTGQAFSLALLNKMSSNLEAVWLLPAKKDANFFRYSTMNGTGTILLQKPNSSVTSCLLI